MTGPKAADKPAQGIEKRGRTSLPKELKSALLASFLEMHDLKLAQTSGSEEDSMK